MRRSSEFDRCLVFLHVPKTAGWTLRGALANKYPSQVLYLDELSDRMGGVEAVPIKPAVRPVSSRAT